METNSEEDEKLQEVAAMDFDRIRSQLLDPSLIQGFYAEAGKNSVSTTDSHDNDLSTRYNADWIPWNLRVISSSKPEKAAATVLAAASGLSVPADKTENTDDKSAAHSESADQLAEKAVENTLQQSTSSSIENRRTRNQDYFPTDSYLDLRIRQNTAFCLQCLEEGLAELQKPGGDPKIAQQKYQKGLEVDPDHVELWISLAIAQARQGLYPAALQSLDKALALQPHNGQAAMFQRQIQEQFQVHQQKAQQQQQKLPVMRKPRALVALQDVQAERALDLSRGPGEGDGNDEDDDKAVNNARHTRHRNDDEYSSTEESSRERARRRRRRRRRKRAERERKREKKRRKERQKKSQKKHRSSSRRRRRYYSDSEEDYSDKSDDDDSRSYDKSSRNRGRRRDDHSRVDIGDDDSRGRGASSKRSNDQTITDKRNKFGELPANSGAESKDIDQKSDIIQQSRTKDETLKVASPANNHTGGRNSTSKEDSKMRRQDQSSPYDDDKDDVSSLSSAQSFRKRRRSRYSRNNDDDDDDNSMGSRSTVDSLELLRKPKRPKRH